MDKQNNSKTDASILRLKAEKLLKEKTLKIGLQLSEYEIHRLVHELEVHQIELELQNEELRQSKILEKEQANEKYAELYDFAPSGFFTLSRDGVIIGLNYSCSQMLGKERDQLINSNFGFFVSDNSKPTFNEFLSKIFKTKIKSTCELTIIPNIDLPVDFLLCGIVTENSTQCMVTMVDITERKQTEELLNKKEVKRIAILDTAMDGYWLFDKKGFLLEVNETYCRMSGYSRQELLTMRIYELEYDKTEDEIFFLIQKIISQKEDRFETRHCRKDGSIFDVEVSIQYQPVEGGQFVTFIHNITNRKQIAEALRQKEEQYKSLFQSNHSIMLLINPDNGEIIDANPTACQYYGWSHAEMCCKNISEINTLSKEDVITEMQKSKEEKRNHFFFKHRLASGEIRDVEVYSGPIIFSDSKFLYSIVHDITDRKRTESALQKNKENLRAILDATKESIYLFDKQGRIVDANITAAARLKRNLNDLVGKKLFSFIPEEIRKNRLLHLNEVFSSGKAVQFEDKRDEYIFEHNFFPVFSNDKVENVVSYSRDITKSRKNEQDLRESEERVRFKLQSILSPEGSIADLELNDIIDTPTIQKLMDNFYELSHIPMAIIDIRGKVLVGVGWQDICTKFHRVHPKSCSNCIESDVNITQGIPNGEFMLYKCKNNMWDMATPLIIGGENKGNLFMGQFFFESEPIDYNQFRIQAEKYGFGEKDYMDALEKVPRLNKQKLEYAKAFFLNLSHSISQLSYSNIKLARAIEQQKKIENALRESEEFLNKAQEIGHIGSWSLDLLTNRLTWSDEIYRIFGIQIQEFTATYEAFLDTIHPEDREAVNSAYTSSIQDGKDSYEIKHRIIRKNSGEVRYVFEKCEHLKDASGKIVRSVGMVSDITDQKKAEEALIDSEHRYRSLFQQSNDAIFLLDVSARKYVDCNFMTETLTGFSREEILTRKIATFLPSFSKNEFLENMKFIMSGNLLCKETEIRTKEGKLIPVEIRASLVSYGNTQQVLIVVHDLRDLKDAMDALKQSEEKVRLKLQSILSPKGNIINLELNDIIDTQAIQKLMDNFYELEQIPVAIIDTSGKVLVNVGWQDICDKFHRLYPEACKYCIETDHQLTMGIPDGEFKLHKCKNNLWDLVTPIIIGGEQKGNLFMGQFFYANNSKVDKLLHSNTQDFSSEEQEYLNVIKKAPHLNKQKLKHAKAFFMNLAGSISQLSYSNIKLARTLAEQKRIEEALLKLNQTLVALSKSSQAMSQSYDEMDFLKKVCDIVVEDTEFAMVWIGFAEDDEAKSILPVASAGFKDDYLKKIKLSWADNEFGRGPTGVAIRTGKVAICNNMLTDPSFEPWRIKALKRGYASSIVFPLFTGDKIIGALTIYSKEIDSFLDAEIKLLSKLASDLSHGITTIRLRTAHQLAEKELIKSHSELEYLVKERTSELQNTNTLLKSEINIRKQQEQYLKLAETKYRTVADYTYDWEYWINDEGKYNYISPSCERISGYTADEFINDISLIDNIVYKPDIEIWKNHSKDEFSISDILNQELIFRIITKTGKIRWIDHTCRKIYIDGKYLGKRASNRDITEQVKAEKELLNVTIEVEERERNRFASELHDGLGPLLSTIKLYFQWLSETKDEDKINIITEKGNNNIDLAIQTTREVAQGLSSLTLNKYGFVDGLLNFNQSINDMQKLCINFTFNSKERFGNFLETTLYRITTELIKNTITYAKASNVEIDFIYSKGKNLITLTYVDNGIGFNIADKISGKGLGMMNIQQRIKILRGIMKIDTGIGKGIQVYIKLPINETINRLEKNN